MPRRVVTVDEKLLNDPELVEYRRIEAILKVPVVGIGFLVAGVTAVVLILVISGGTQIVKSAESGRHFIDMLLGILTFGILIVGGLATFGLPKAKLEGARKRYRKEMADFQSHIRYEQREAEAKRSGGDYDDARPYYPITGNYDPQRYFSYSRSERDYMKMMDMDADTYDSNMPD